MSSEPVPRRDTAVDLFRGLGLWFLFIDHFEPNFWSHLTPGHLGFSDFAEIFVFLSGYVNAGMYLRAFEAGGMRQALRKSGRRMRRLYLAHLASMAATMGLLAAFASHVRLVRPDLYLWMDAPAGWAARALVLIYAPHWFNLLRLYVILSPVALIAVIGLRRWPLTTLGTSCMIWLLAQEWSIPLPPAISGPAVWSYNPLAWQFLLVLGVGAAMYRDRVGTLVGWRLLQSCAAAFIFISAALRIGALFNFVRSAIFELHPALLRLLDRDAGKATLSPLRLLHFLCLLIVLSAIPWDPRRIPRSPVARMAIGVGRDSLLIFCVTLVLTAAGNLILRNTPKSLLLQLAFSLFGPVVMTAIAYARHKIPAAA